MSNAVRLILWGRALDRKYSTFLEQRAHDNRVYRDTLKEEKNDLHDEDANRLIRERANYLTWRMWNNT